MERWYGFGVEAHFDQGMKEHNNGNVAQAITHFQECLAISNSHTTRVRARHYLVQCYSILADEFIEQREYEQASILLHKAIRLQPGYADLHFKLSIIYDNTGDSERQVECLDQALSINPKYARALLFRGLVYYQALDWVNAFEYFELAILCDPLYDNQLFEFAMECHKRGKHPIAISAIKSIENPYAFDANLHAQIGSSYARHQEYAKAIEEYRVALEIAPGYADIRNMIGSALLEMGETDEAIYHFNIAIDINQNYADAHAHLGIAYRRKGEQKLAVHHFNEALRVDPFHVIANYEVAQQAA